MVHDKINHPADVVNTEQNSCCITNPDIEKDVSKIFSFGDQFEAQKENGTNAEKNKSWSEHMVTDTFTEISFI